MTDDRHQAGVLILGGGLAGAAAAILLARAGRPVTLVERDAVPRHKVCGEFLSVEAVDLLQELGVDPAHSGAPGIHSVRLASGRRLVEARLPFVARSLSRRCLDGLLLHAAGIAGATVVRGRAVTELSREGDRWRARLGTGEVFCAPQVICATGKHDLRGYPRPRGPQGDLVALKMYFRLTAQQTAAVSGAVELWLHPQGYTGLQLVEDGSANLCALVRREHLARLGGWQGLLIDIERANPHAAERLCGAVPLLEKPLAISSIPYGFVRRRSIAPGMYAVGDQAAVIPSFTGDGMSVALYTGVRAAESVLAGKGAEAFQIRMWRDLRKQIGHATTLSRALLHPLGRPFLLAAAHLWPESLSRVASLTRLQTQVHASEARSRTGVPESARGVDGPARPGGEKDVAHDAGSR